MDILLSMALCEISQSSQEFSYKAHKTFSNQNC
jgi:hypothetical protein